MEEESISFEDLGLDETTLAAVERKGFVTPSPVQVLAIPRLLNGDSNVIARARTGTGKTAAFGLPLVQQLREESDHVRAIILEPTRELAMQTCTEMSSFATGRFPRNAVVYGGASIGLQIKDIKRGVEIVTGTPGRVQDLIDRGVLDISKIDYFILDEGDEMLDMGFVDDIENIFAQANPDCRVLLFSATVPAPILKIAAKFMGDYEIVEEEGHEEEPLLIEQKYWVVRESEKTEALIRLIDYSPDFYGLVFVQKKTDADYVCRQLDEKGYEVAALHGDIPQGQREKILARFRSGKTRVLVATDVAARGIDIEGLTHVVNYSLPFDGPTYVHRIGRTGRAGAAGMAVTFVCPNERRRLGYMRNAIKKSAKGELEEGTIPSVREVIEVRRDRLFGEIKNKLFSKANNIIPEEQLGEGEADISETSENSSPVLVKAESVFEQLASEICENQNAVDVVASLLSLTYAHTLTKDRYGKISTYSSREEKDRGGKGEGRSRGGRSGKVVLKENQIRLYVQMGWHDKANPRSIAEFFSKLLKIPGRLVDDIDMADKFCLVSLPADAGRKALALSEKDKSLPHMHQDVMNGGTPLAEGAESTSRKPSVRTRGRPSKKSFADSGKKSRFDGAKKSSSRSVKSGSGRSSSKKESTRSAKSGAAKSGAKSSASLYRKKSASTATEY